MVVCFSVLPNDKWKRLQPHHCPEVDKRLEKWMDIFIIWLVLVRSKTLEVQRYADISISRDSILSNT